MSTDELARMIDHTLLKPNATASQIDQLCDEAMKHGFYSVCVNASRVARCASRLSGSQAKTCSVVGFPLGAASTASKAVEAKAAVADGADELDMVINIGRLLDADLAYVKEDIGAVVAAAEGRAVKVIIEACYLDDAGIVEACRLAETAGAAFVKTSTGFGPSGATVHAVRLMRATVGDRLGVKAAGGIRDYTTAVDMINAGANRIGASVSVQILEGARLNRIRKA